jgi:hypothetical protein
MHRIFMTWDYIYYKIGEISFITMKLCQHVYKTLESV